MLKTHSVCVVVGILLSSICFAGAPKYSVKTQFKNQAIEVTVLPPEAHHFNLEAPKSLTFAASTNKVKPSDVKKSAMVFRFPVAIARDATLSLYVCDDKNTYCERQDVLLKWNGKDDFQVLESVKSDVKLDEPSPKTGADAHGFILNDYSGALEVAQTKNLPVLIDFFGIWCPPCNYLEQRVFMSPEFKKRSDRFVKLKIDVDSAKNAELLSKYKIAGFPTLIIASPQGDEIYRILGSRPKHVVLSELKKALSLFLTKGWLNSNDEKGRLAFDREDYVAAEKLLKESKQYREYFMISRAKVLLSRLDSASPEEEAKASDAFVQAVQTAINEFPKSWRASLDLQSDLDNYYEGKKSVEKSKAVKKRIIAFCHEFLNRPDEAEDAGFPIGEVWMTIADLESKLGNKEISNLAWEKSAGYFKANSQSSKDKMHQLYYAVALSKLEKLKEADEILEGLQKNYPADFTYYYHQAKINYNFKKYEKAAELAKKALGFTYDNNRLTVVLLLAKIYKDSGQSKDASRLIDDTLQTMKITENTRADRFAKQLREIQKSLN